MKGVVKVNLIVFLIFGAIVGWLASVVMKTNSSQGLLADIILGILGSIVGGYVMSLLGFGGVSGFNIYSILVGLVGAIVLIMIGRMIRNVAQ